MQLVLLANMKLYTTFLLVPQPWTSSNGHYAPLKHKRLHSFPAMQFTNPSTILCCQEAYNLVLICL